MYIGIGTSINSLIKINGNYNETGFKGLAIILSLTRKYAVL